MAITTAEKEEKAVAPEPKRQPYPFYLDRLPLAEDRAQAFLEAYAVVLRHTNYKPVLELYARNMTHCGRCATTCPVYQATGDPRDIPCHRSQQIVDIYKRYFTPGGWLRAKLLGDDPLTNQKVDEIAASLYRCTACRRCSIECPLGLDHGLITHFGRYVLSEAGIAPKGLVVSVREQLEGKTRNTSAVPLPALVDTLQFLEEDFADTKGGQIRFPLDVAGADYVFFTPVSDYLMEAETLMGIAAVLTAGGVNWTIGTQVYDAINYGLFYNDWVLDRVDNEIIRETRRLQGRNILIGECGHASRAAKFFVPTFNRGEPLPVINIIELTYQLLQTGKIDLDPDVVTQRVTYHDPCNIARTGWIVEQPRVILRSFVKGFVEMTPNGRENYCCGGGGGTVSLDEIHKFRMEVAGRAKVEQIRATGAEIVIAPCANCKKQLRELVNYHKLPVEVMGLHDLIMRAIRMPKASSESKRPLDKPQASLVGTSGR
ncbi:MAG: (Fe-S)-binding protein [Chloroflexi bacterium]|nr:(Fe-S)-binding protein [Chloroflexota bacterium]